MPNIENIDLDEDSYKMYFQSAAEEYDDVVNIEPQLDDFRIGLPKTVNRDYVPLLKACESGLNYGGILAQSEETTKRISLIR